jgi:hypothetical protein
MNLPELQRKLIAAARANPPADTVPYAFEKRILARLAAPPVFDPWGLWARGLSRAAAFCVLGALLCGAYSFFAPVPNTDTLAQDVETALFAAVDNPAADASQSE